ncbi:MAG: hypothetical protein KGJ74_07985 [Betaproteobacteria bacterium]|jgi:hypothetical protein|nr:hypothetical protein [Betaproteobacteria bacterium]
MRQTRRQFIQQSLLAVPAISALASCGGGGSTAITATGGNSSGVALPPQSGIDLSVGLKDYGKSFVPYSPLPKPAKLVPFTDPDFGTSMVRLTDAAKDFSPGASVCAPAYPTTQAWNCDETRLILYVTTYNFNSGNTQGWAMYDGKTYAFIKFLPIAPSDIEQFWWDTADPTLLYYIANPQIGSNNYSQLTAINVNTNATTVIYDFAATLQKIGWTDIFPVRAGYPLANGGPNNQIWGLGAGSSTSALMIFGFNRLTGQITTYDTSIAPRQPRTEVPFPRLTGNGWVWNNTNFTSQSRYETWVLDAAGKVVNKLNFSADEHLDTSINAAGQDVLIGSEFDTPVQGNMVMANLETGAITTLIGPANGYGYTRSESFVGATAYKNRAWIVGASVGSPYGTASDLTSNNAAVSNPQTLLDQEVYIANIDTSAVLRIAHHRSTGQYQNAPVSNYWAQPNVTISPSGTRILFQSDWGCADPKNPVINPSAIVDTYVIHLPQYKG